MSEKKLPPRVLIVDDEILQRKIVSQQLLKLGFASEAVATAADAVEVLQAKDFDVVLLDVQMSDLSGLEALPLIKNLEDAPEIVMLTLDKTLESGVAALRAGAYDYLTKPANISALEATVTKATEKRRLVRQNKTLKDYVESKTARVDLAGEPTSASVAMRQIIEQAEAVAELNSASRASKFSFKKRRAKMKIFTARLRPTAAPPRFCSSIYVSRPTTPSSVSTNSNAAICSPFSRTQTATANAPPPFSASANELSIAACATTTSKMESGKCEN